jgi:hypothetical protein
MKKRQAAAVVAQFPPLKKTTEKRKPTKGLSLLRDQTSEQEKALAKPVKQSKKFRVQSSGLSFTEKTSSVKIVPRPIAGAETGRQKKHPALTAGGSVGHALVCAIDLYPSSASEEASPLERHQKNARNSRSLKASSELSADAIVEGLNLAHCLFSFFRKLQY